MHHLSASPPSTFCPMSFSSSQLLEDSSSCISGFSVCLQPLTNRNYLVTWNLWNWVFSKYLNLQNALQIITALLLCHSWVIRFRECELQSSFATESNICNRLKVCDCKMGLPSASAKYMTPKNSLLSANLNQIPNTVLWDIPPLKTPIKSGVLC